MSDGFLSFIENVHYKKYVNSFHFWESKRSYLHKISLDLSMIPLVVSSFSLKFDKSIQFNNNFIISVPSFSQRNINVVIRSWNIFYIWIYILLHYCLFPQTNLLSYHTPSDHLREVDKTPLAKKYLILKRKAARFEDKQY